MLVVIKGAGDLATGIAHRLKRVGIDVVMTEIAYPTVVRHTVAFASAVYQNKVCVEGVTALLCHNIKEVNDALEQGEIPIVIDPQAQIVKTLQPDAVVDAIIAKRNIGTKITDAKVVVGVGPGFDAGVDCHYVVETQRGHHIGRVIDAGCAAANTGIPGEIGGYTVERIIRAPKEGRFRGATQIGDAVQKNQIVGYVGDEPIYAQIAGIVRGILVEEMDVTEGFKCGDIDPRCIKDHCFSISDKSRSIAGGVLEAVLRGNQP
ncbi:MAG: selenium-dependent molybdenum cofactor biosynthesis protein YqeB [Cellulosilyticaceae bacterium]